ncbi:MAG: hypothetical protein ABH846_04835 [Patescibacteria group bacterium]
MAQNSEYQYDVEGRIDRLMGSYLAAREKYFGESREREQGHSGFEKLSRQETIRKGRRRKRRKRPKHKISYDDTNET